MSGPSALLRVTAGLESLYNGIRDGKDGGFRKQEQEGTCRADIARSNGSDHSGLLQLIFAFYFAGTWTDGDGAFAPTHTGT